MGRARKDAAAPPPSRSPALRCSERQVPERACTRAQLYPTARPQGLQPSRLLALLARLRPRPDAAAKRGGMKGVQGRAVLWQTC